MIRAYNIEDWGEVPYLEAFQKQQDYVAEIVAGVRPETLVFCTHPPVVTLGRGTRPGDVFAWTGETVEVNRGGRATYHGPSQIVFYPLLHLGEPNEQYILKKIPAKDLHTYFRIMEQSMIDLLQLYGVKGKGYSLQKQVGDEGESEATGVWVGNRKIASIGIAVRKWVSFHGAALNIYHDPNAFTGMNPCGFKSEQMVSLEQLIGAKVDRKEMTQTWSESFKKLI